MKFVCGQYGLVVCLYRVLLIVELTSESVHCWRGIIKFTMFGPFH